jgi:hypothetical protein
MNQGDKTPITATAKPRRPISCETQIRGFLAEFDRPIATLARSARRRLRRYFPSAIELVYNGYNALALGFCTSERASDCIASVAVYPRNVALSFYHGASLPDPKKILAGQGAQNRYLRLSSAAQLDDPAVRALFAAAVAHVRSPMPVGRGRSIVKSNVAKRRPRRGTTRD